MTEWLTYSLSDFLLFSSDTYFRLYERYNKALWPWQLLPLTAGVMIPFIIKTKRDRSGRWVASIFALSWLWVAWGYHFQRYTTINWFAPVFFAIFFLEAVLLIWVGIVRNRLFFTTSVSASNRVGWGIYYFALLCQPLFTPLLGNAWTEAGLFGTTPDPTAIATSGMLLFASNRSHWGLLIIPLIWCAISGATLYGLSSHLAIIMFLALSIVLVCGLIKSIKYQPTQS